ncbi:MAG: 2,3-bisphosphoglycerate-independent phosphoglycerate mutase [Candidatus Eisenbacteria bacterium]|nr:2,3-bisphosphoglycerate-independent phosphoglycerate mutase [Candidatus Eisenbacteria bacterium]
MDAQHQLLQRLQKPSDRKIVLVVADGLGGLPQIPDGPTELEAAATPHLDLLAAGGVCGLHWPVLPGITAGSGPGHLALFGYDPLVYEIGRGVLSALGVAFDLHSGDVAARGNFCTLDDRGRVTDRRAGRIATAEAARLVEKLRRIELPDARLFLEPVREHRFVLVLRGERLDPGVGDTDPQQTGIEPHAPKPLRSDARTTARLVERFLGQAHELLSEERPANGVLLRGFSQRPDWPTLGELHGVRACALPTYPMYRGLARLLGMEVGVDSDADLTGQITALEENWERFDFFFLHHKEPDSRGEDGNFVSKVSAIERLDGAMPRIQALQPDVLLVTGDHSTPSRLRSHSWHPVPVLLASRTARPDTAQRFGESACRAGGLGLLPGKQLMALALAHAERLEKFGA